MLKFFENKNTKKIQNEYKKYSFLFLFLASLSFVGFFVVPNAFAATGINKQISFQGKVVNTDGTNVTSGSYTFLFCIYTTASPATACTAGADNDAVWRESKSITVTDGIFQTNLGDTTAFASLIDFNTDNIYLGINFNANGQMSPLVRFTATPYALNAAKVGGLTVTDTTGTLTIPNSETISFGGSFSTTASNDIALTTSGATTLTLPTTGTLATLAGTEVLTNKTIGSTGLTFSGAATDITTASGESLVVVAAGAGTIDLQDATTVDSLTTDTGGVTIASGQSYSGSGAVTLSSAAATALTVDSGTTGALNIGTGNNAKTIALGTGTAGNIINIGTNNTVSDTIAIGSVLDNVAITGDQWSITDAGVLTVVSCSGCGGVSANSLDFAEFQNQLDLDASTDINAPSGQAYVLSITNEGTGNSFLVNDVATDTTPFVINASGNVGIGDATPESLLDLEFSQVSGSLLNITAPSATTLTGALYGQYLDLSTNITATNQNVTGSFIGLPSITNTGASRSYYGQYISRGNYTSTGTANIESIGLNISETNITQTAGSVEAVGIAVATGSITTGGAQTGIAIYSSGVGVGTLTGLDIAPFGITPGAGTETALKIGAGWDTYLDTASIDISGAGAITGATGVSTTTVTASSAIAANGGITFDASTDTVGAFTSAGTIDMSTNILTNIGNTGTDFVASTGALTLAGVLTANGGISLSGSQSLSAAALAFVDLGLITQSSTANQGLRLPNAASATPSNPTSGEGYLAWDAAGNQLITYNGSAWTTVGGVSANSLDFAEFQNQLDLDASTDILAPSGQAYVLSITNEGTGNSFRVNDANTDTTPFVIDASGNVGILDSTPDALLDLDFAQTSGTLFGIAAPSALTLAGDLTGQNINLSTNVTATGRSITGTSIALPAVTNTGSGIYIYQGLGVAGGAITQTTAGGNDIFNGIGITNANLTQTTGTLSSVGLSVATGSNTTGGTQSGVSITATGVGAGTLNGVNISAITAGAGTETALVIGSGWDTYLDTASIDISGAGAITGATGVSTTTVTATSTIDARGDVSDSTGNLTLNDAVDISGALVVSGTSLTATSATTITLGSSGPDTIILGNAGADTITIGNVASTGVSIVDNNWSVTTGGVATFITGSVIGSQTFTTNNIADSGALTIASGSATALTLNSGTNGAINIGTDASAEIINIGNTGAAVKTIAIGNNTQANTITIGDATVTGLSLTDNNWSISATGVAAFASLSSSGAIAANGGITFDASTDTVGAHTLSGTIDANTNILTNIGNTGTDFVASTGALTLAGILTANGGMSLSGSQSFTASALAYMDLGSIVHNTTAVQGLRLPQAASATPSNPTSGEGYLAWDAAGNQLITYNGSAWTTLSGGGGYNLIKDETTSLTVRTTLAFLGAGVSCADNASQTECTISGGAGSDLQGTYGADADGSNVTISLTAADDGLVFTNPSSGGNNLSTFLLQLDQANTTANVLTLDIIQASNASNAVNVTANAIDGETGLAITTNGLTSGKGISITSSATAFTGNLTDISLTGSNASNTGNVLAVSNTGTANANTALFVDHRATGTGNLALRVDDESGDTTPFIIDGAGRVGIQASAPTEALTVGSATNRANMVAYGDVTSEGYDIQKSLSGIIDIFVYDTTRDADSGEWRNSMLSQQLSWATETIDNTGVDCVIGTDDRCGKSTFPRKAIIATTATGLYIFDGADNTLWMAFAQNASGYALGVDTNNNPSGVGAQNGVIVVGTNGSAGSGVYTFDFKQDTMFRYNATNRVQGDKNIGNRNSAVTYATDANTNMAIANSIVNDVSIAMITSSTNGMANTLTLPTDSATSPVRGMTLIAVANDTAISVINMAGRKTLSYSETAGDDYNQVVLTSRARLYATNETQGQLEEWRNIDRDVAAELAGNPDRFYDELTPTGAAGKTPITTGTAPTMTTSPGSLAVIERSSSARESAATTLLETGDIVFVGTNQGLAEVHTSGGNLVGASWSKITTTTVATPYMVGAPRGVYLFDEAVGATAATSAVGTAGTTKNVLDSAVTATAPTFGANGVRGKGINFNNNSYLCTDANADGTCDSDTDFNAGLIGFTVSLWFKHGVTAAADTLFERCYTPATPTAAVGCIYAGMHTTGQIRFAIDSLTTWTYNTTYDDNILSTASYNDNQWHHAVFTNTDTDICMYIDGKQAVACDAAIAATATMDAAQVLTVGGSCAGANCVTGANFWDGSIDDFVWSSNGATTDNGVVAQSATKLYLDGRAHLIRPSVTVTDADVFSSTTIGDSGEAYIPGSFSGLVVELTQGTGTGQTRTIISNTATTFTVYPAFATTPDATTDYAVSPGRLYGASNNVTAIAPDLPTNLNKIRKVYVGTDDGADGGGVSVFTNAGTGSIKTEVIHSDAGYAADDLGSTWSGTGADNITALSAYSDTVAVGSDIFQRAQRKEISLKQLQLDTIGGFEDIRQELVSKQLFGSTQDVLGLGQGADLAERYYSDEVLDAGEIVSLDSRQEAGVKRSALAYQRDVIGVVATRPALILGAVNETAYPVALVGRVPVKVTNENGQIYAGDRVTTSSRPGHGMFADQAGRVIGTALSDAVDWVSCEESGESTSGMLCTTVLIFVNLTDYSGQPVELAMARHDTTTQSAGLSPVANIDSVEQGLGSETASIRLATSVPTKQEKILSFLKELHAKQVASSSPSSEVFTGRVSASTEVITPTLYVDQIFAKSIKADSIEGLSIWTNQIASLEQKYAGLEANTPENPLTGDVTSTAEKTLLNLEKFTVGTFTASLDASILGKLSLAGGMTVGGDAQFASDTVFAKLASFFGKTLFKDTVSFEKTPLFGRDTAGFAVIEKGARKVRVVFDAPYEKQPIVTVALTNDASPLLSDADESLKKDIEVLEEEYLESVFDKNIRFVVTEKSIKGFAIVLSEKAPRDLQFSWVALSVGDAKSFNSEKEKEALPVTLPPEPLTSLVEETPIPVSEPVIEAGAPEIPEDMPLIDTPVVP